MNLTKPMMRLFKKNHGEQVKIINLSQKSTNYSTGETTLSTSQKTITAVMLPNIVKRFGDKLIFDENAKEILIRVPDLESFTVNNDSTFELQNKQYRVKSITVVDKDEVLRVSLIGLEGGRNVV